jgi:hypothetical protein
MADPLVHALEGVFAPRVETDKLIGAAGAAEEILNLRLTPENTLRTISGPAILVDEDIETHGVVHATIGSREVLIRQTVDKLQIFEGWGALPAAQWRDLITLPAVVNDTPSFPFMAVTTPTGVVILPKGDSTSPLWFDGEILDTLGYQLRPAAPTLATSLEKSKADLLAAGPPNLGDIGSRVGTVEAIQGSTTNLGRRIRCEYEGGVQWIDRWGNLSPVSPRSNVISVTTAVIHTDHALERGLFRLRWTDVDPGPKYTKGRILLRTRNLTVAGTTTMFEVPQHAAPSNRVFSTIPDNIGQLYSDNASDGRLSLPERDITTVPNGKVGTLAMGRLWLDSPDGGVWFSLPGRYGTFATENVIYPDASGAKITGMHAVAGGLLVFTTHSTFFIEPNDDGADFRRTTVSTTIGCIAPATVKTMPDGVTVWLGRDGFNGFSQGQIGGMPADHSRLIRQINPGRMQQSVAEVIEGIYHCWVPHGAATANNLCLTFNGAGWGRRNDVLARSVTLTSDYRAYALIAGKDVNTARKGILVLDHEGEDLGSQNHTAVMETAWMLADGVDTKSVRRLVIWARETALADLTVQVYINWREDLVETLTIPLNAPEDPPGSWDTEVLGTAGGALWHRRRPFYGVVDVDLPSIESLKLKFTAVSNIDFVGFVLQTGAGIKAGSWGG